MRTIEVYADVMCPFAYVGLRAFEERRAERGAAEPVVVVRAWPLEIVNGKPHDGNHLAPEIEALRTEVAPGLFAGFDPKTFPRSTLSALAATAAAYRRSPTTGDAFALAVRVALFEEGLDVSDPTVLANLAEDIGVEEATEADRASIDADLAAGRERGVAGSPHWFTSRRDFFCPSLEIHHEGDRWDVHFDRKGFDEFLDAALG
ncbi:MAG: DsbA family protein [Acidimicrobiia bacterium]|jgi:predicted DsbA family dithiol-disulfide isomerase